MKKQTKTKKWPKKCWRVIVAVGHTERARCAVHRNTVGPTIKSSICIIFKKYISLKLWGVTFVSVSKSAPLRIKYMYGIIAVSSI